MGLGIERLNKDRKVLGERLQGKAEVRTDVSKQSNTMEY